MAVPVNTRFKVRPPAGAASDRLTVKSTLSLPDASPAEYAACANDATGRVAAVIVKLADKSAPYGRAVRLFASMPDTPLSARRPTTTVTWSSAVTAGPL